MDEELTVGQLVDVLNKTGVNLTVRTLHHWDEIGLLRPSERTSAGYRLYTGRDLVRAQRVVIYRELGLSLETISEVLSPQAAVVAQLTATRTALTQKIARLQGMEQGVKRMIQAHESGVNLTPEQQKEVFGDDFKPEWLTEARDRWGGNDAWAQHAERAAQRSPQDWRDLTAAGKDMEFGLARGFAAHIAPGSAEANELAEAHLAWLNNHFDVGHARQVCLAHMYVADPRFAAHYDAHGAGMTAWLLAIISENARAHGVDPETAAWG